MHTRHSSRNTARPGAWIRRVLVGASASAQASRQRLTRKTNPLSSLDGNSSAPSFRHLDALRLNPGIIWFKNVYLKHKTRSESRLYKTAGKYNNGYKDSIWSGTIFILKYIQKDFEKR